jgi:hypothetical protein
MKNDDDIHDPLAITPADAPRREILAVLAEAEASPLRGLGSLLGMPFGNRTVQHGDRVLVMLAGQDKAAQNGPWWAQDGDWTRPTVEEQIELSRAKDRAEGERQIRGLRAAGLHEQAEDAEAEPADAEPPPAAYVWRVRDLAAPDAVTRYTLARRRDNLVLVADAHNDRRRFRDLEGFPLPSSIEADELAAGDPAATPATLAAVERMLEDTAPEGHEVERVETEQPPTVPRPARQEPETTIIAALTIAALAHLDRVRLRRGQEPTAGPRMAWVVAADAPTARTMLACGFTTDELLEAIRAGALVVE